MLYSEKHANEGKARGLEKSPQGQVFVQAHHEEVQGRQLRGQGNFQWNTDLIETKKLENCNPQVTQDLYCGKAQHEPRGAHEEKHCRSLHEKHRNELRTHSLVKKRRTALSVEHRCQYSQLRQSDGMFTTTHLSDHVQDHT